MSRNLSSVAVVVVFILSGLALGMMWGVRFSQYFRGSDLEALALSARPVVTVVVFCGCGLALYARTLRAALPILVGIGVTQLVVSIAYAALLWLPHSSFLRPPVG